MTDTRDSEEGNGVESLKNFERALGHVRNSVRPLTLMSREEVGACVSSADRAKLNLQLAYGVTSLFYMFLRTQGVSPTTHPVKTELDRIRGYFGRLKHAGKPPAQRTLKVDTEASRRFIDSALSGDSVWKSATSKRGNKSDQAVETGIGRSTPAGQPDNYVQLQQQRIHEERELQGKKVPEETPSLSSVATTPGKRKHNSSDNTTTGKRGKQVNNGNGNGEDRSSSSSSGVWSGRNETGAGTIGGEAKWGTRPSATDEGGGGEGGTGAKKSPSGGNKSKGGGGKKGGTRYHQRKW